MQSMDLTSNLDTQIYYLPVLVMHKNRATLPSGVKQGIT